MSNGNNNQSSISTQRLEAFSDSVFAIVITLLFLNLSVPQVGNPTDWRELLEALRPSLPKFVSIGVSFFFVAIFWVAHHQFFHTLRETTRGLLWLNLIFLFMACFIPFPATVLVEFPNNETAVVLFGTTVLLTGLTLSALRWYAWRKHREITSLVRSNDQIGKALRRSVLIVVFNMIGIGVSFFHPFAAIVIYLLTPLTLIFPVRVEIENDEEESDEESSEVVL